MNKPSINKGPQTKLQFHASRVGWIAYAGLLLAPLTFAANTLHTDFFNPAVSDAMIAQDIQDAIQDYVRPVPGVTPNPSATPTPIPSAKEALKWMIPTSDSKLFKTKGRIDSVDFKVPGYAFKYALNYYIPTTVDLKKMKRSIPVIFFLHGGGDSTASYDTSKAVSQRYAKYFTSLADYNGAILLFPSSGLGWGFQTLFLIREALTLAKRELPIDLNRVAISGHSMGAMGIGRSYAFMPDLAMGYLALSGMIGDGNSDRNQMKTLYNVPFTFLDGDLDPFEGFKPAMEKFTQKVKDMESELGAKTKFQMLFHPGAHNFNLGQGYTEMIKLLAKPRDLYQKDLYATFFGIQTQATSKEPGFPSTVLDRYFWLKLLDYSKPDSMKLAYFEGHIHDNTVSIQTTLNGLEAKKMRIYLADGMVDFTQPVVIAVDGRKVFSGSLKKGMDQTIRMARENHDPGFLFDTSIDVDLKAPVASPLISSK